MNRKIFIIIAFIAIISCKKIGESWVSFVVDEPGRRLVGPGIEYVPTSLDSEKLANDLNRSMQKRRRFAWEVIQKVTANVSVSNIQTGVPLWMTWYSPSEIKNLFEIAYTDPNKKMGKNGFDAAYVTSIIKNPALGNSNLKEKEFNKFLARINAAEKSGKLGTISGINGSRRQGFTMVSPAYVQHVLENFVGISNCDSVNIDKYLDLMGQKSFSPCMPEFPRQSVMIKTSWEKVPDFMDNFDLSAEALGTTYAQSLEPRSKNATPVPWPRVKGQAKVPMPGPDKIFRITGRDDTQWALRAIHIVTKEIREWVWITLSWSANPDVDFGQDRPANILAPWNNYKMMVVTSFEENDATPYFDAKGEPLLALKAIHDFKASKEGKKVLTWASDPHIEIEHFKSNCIGCHGAEGDAEERTRKNFPTDFSFLISPGSAIDVSVYFKNIISGKIKPGEDTSVKAEKEPHAQ